MSRSTPTTMRQIPFSKPKTAFVTGMPTSAGVVTPLSAIPSFEGITNRA